MAKFSINVVLDNGTTIDNVSAIFPDQAVIAMVSAAENLGHVDKDGQTIVGGRAITYAIRWFLTNLVKEYANEAASKMAIEAAKAQVDALLSEISIEETP
jgi:hypothetical protein